MSAHTTIQQQRTLLLHKQTTSASLVAKAAARISDPQGEGIRAFIGGVSPSVQTQAVDADALIAQGGGGELIGLPIAIKDLFDVQGEVTRAGARVLADEPAADDSGVVARLRVAGAVLIGRTNMSEFAYTGVGTNPHYGTPSNPWDRPTGRTPGGSSSGAAVAVADGMAVAAIGTDTGGSCRIPAALCGIVGFKPTAGAIPINGMVPLSPSYDSVGSLANSVQCCALLDQVMSGRPVQMVLPATLHGLRVGLPSNLVLDELDDEVASRYEIFKQTLAAAGAVLTPVELVSYTRLPELAVNGGIVAAEAFAWHAKLLATQANAYDPLVLERIQSGKTTSNTDYLELLDKRSELRHLFEQETKAFDILVMPTVPLIAPPIAQLAKADEFYRVNRLLLRNTAPANIFNTGAISLPFGAQGRAPVGMMLVGKRHEDDRLLSIAEAVFATFHAPHPLA